jgi:outer membrane cobalamin receptor
MPECHALDSLNNHVHQLHEKRSHRMSRILVSLVFIILIQICVADQEVDQTTSVSTGPLYELDEVVIIASRREMLLRDTPDIVAAIGQERIGAMQPTSVGEVIGYGSGVSVETGTGSGLPKRTVVGINGLPANYTLVLVDGVRLLTEHIHSGQNLEFLPPGSIERLEIMRGAASAQYGTGAIGGIVNVVTRKCKEQWSAYLNATAGSYGTYETSANLLLPVQDFVRLSSSLHWEQSDGIPLKAPAHRMDNMGYKRRNLLNRLDVDLGDATELFGSLNWVDNTMDWRGNEAESHLVAPIVGISHALLSNVDVEVKVAYSKWKAEVNSEMNMLFEPQVHTAWRVTQHHTINAGIDYKWNEFERTAVDAPKQAAYGVFLQQEWVDPQRFSLMLAARYDDVEDIGAAFSPKFSLLVLPAEHIRLRASLGRGFHAPTLQELYEEGYGHGGTAYRFGNPDLEPEYSTTCTAGLEATLHRGVQLMLYGFYNEIQDMIVPVYEGPWDEDPEINVWRRTNIENAEVYGAEANIRINVNGAVRVEGGYTYTKNKDLHSGRKLPYSPGSSSYGRVALSHDLRSNVNVDGFVGVRMASDREAWNWKPPSGAPADDMGGLTTPLADYTKLDAGLTVSVNSSYEATLKIENILGEDIENLDDVFTVIDGEPVFHIGLGYRIQFAQ